MTYHHCPKRKLFLLSPLYRWGNWVQERQVLTQTQIFCYESCVSHHCNSTLHWLQIPYLLINWIFSIAHQVWTLTSLYSVITLRRLFFILFLMVGIVTWVSQAVLMAKNLSAHAGDIRDLGLIPGSGRFPWKWAWQPTLVFLPRKSHTQSSLAGPSP